MCDLKCLSNADVTNEWSIYFKEKGKLNSAKNENCVEEKYREKICARKNIKAISSHCTEPDNEKKLFLKQEISASYIQQHGNLSRYEATFQCSIGFLLHLMRYMKWIWEEFSIEHKHFCYAIVYFKNLIKRTQKKKQRIQIRLFQDPSHSLAIFSESVCSHVIRQYVVTSNGKYRFTFIFRFLRLLTQFLKI